MRYLIIGAVAAGTKAASKIRREDGTSEITVLTSDSDISYAGCGLPYYIGDVIKERGELVVRKPEDFKMEQDINVLTGWEALRIDPVAKKVLAKELKTGEEREFIYDRLILATGASPFVPPIEGVNLDNVFTLRRVTDADRIKRQANSGIKNAVIVGGGFIGLEVGENLAKRGVGVTVIEMMDTILPGFDKEIALTVQNYLKEKGIDILTGEAVQAFKGDGRVNEVITSKRTLPCDIAILSIGVRPNTRLAVEAGIELGPTKAIAVNEQMETNIKDIYAVGDCAENVNLITGQRVWYPMGSTANKTGRIAGINLADGEWSFNGVLGTTIVKLFDMTAAKTGLSEADARKNGFDVVTVLVPSEDRAHYIPGYRMITTKLIVDRKNRRVLGGQIVGEGVVDKPIDILATAITFGAKADDLVNLDLAYAPPVSTAMASTIVAGEVAVNKLDGKLKGISPVELHENLDKYYVVDVRIEPEFIISSIPGSVNVPFGMLRKKADELPRDKEIVLVCKIGKRAYMAYRILSQMGFENIRILDGGISSYPFETV
ncbi:MAG: FAD-dependent oxidoreductase [Thermoanaerobacteraceae bacterium]|nr:FAD-dependent oxidoreductase [Thermoanaerobacteraceae bacterium]